MVAKTPDMEKRRLEKRISAALDPNLVKETLKKVDKCMARLQELQYTVAGGAKTVSGVNLSPRSTRGYLRTSLRCKQEFLRTKNAATTAARKSPAGKTQHAAADGEWKLMSLPAALLGETVVEILHASKAAKEIAVAAAAAKLARRGNVTPDAAGRRSKVVPNSRRCEGSELKSRRTKELQQLRRTRRSEFPDRSPAAITRARAHIVFKPAVTAAASSRTPPAAAAAMRVSPKNRPWAKKAVLFPNPIFRSGAGAGRSPPSRFYKTKSPIIARAAAMATPHKIAIKSTPSSLRSKFRGGGPAVPAARVCSPSPVAQRRCSFSPSKIAGRMMSPFKKRVGGGGGGGGMNNPFRTPVRIASTKRIFGAPPAPSMAAIDGRRKKLNHPSNLDNSYTKYQ